MNLQEKIIAIQSDLKTNVEKTQKSGKDTKLTYDYSRESDVLQVIKPLLKEYKLGYLLSQGETYSLDCYRDTREVFNQYKKITETKYIEQWTYSSMGSITLIDSDTNETYKLPCAFIGGNTDPAKAYGSALTYGTKYALKKIFGLPDDELDPDNEQGQEKREPKKEIQIDTNIKQLFEAMRNKSNLKLVAPLIKPILDKAGVRELNIENLSKYVSVEKAKEALDIIDKDNEKRLEALTSGKLPMDAIVKGETN